MATVFKRILDGELPARFVHQDEHCVAFHDVHPQAPVHLLFIPRREIRSLAEAVPDDAALLGHILTVIPQVAAALGLKDGYRVVCNTGADGGQTVPHLHFHLLAGRPLTWPPG
jgi:histidine triad (HIT) family protein